MGNTGLGSSKGSVAKDLRVVDRTTDDGEVEHLFGSFEADRQLVEISPSVVVGGRAVIILAGPCSVESEEQVLSVAHSVSHSGAVALRGGAFKPRTSPYSFQGLGVEGLKYLKAAGGVTGMPVISEIMDARNLEEMLPYVDVFQVGARNMYNYPLLKELGGISKPVLLKRAISATIDEFLGAAEYLVSRGNNKVLLCERGIRSFDSSTRFCLDLAAIPVIKEKSKLPIIIDPSHGTGVARYVESMSIAAIAAGADGLLIEVHNNPANALSDGAQSLSFEQFRSCMIKSKRVAHAIGRTL